MLPVCSKTRARMQEWANRRCWAGIALGGRCDTINFDGWCSDPCQVANWTSPASKSKQTKEPLPTPMGITRKSEIKTLGVTLSQSFSMKTQQRHHFLWPGFVCDENPEVTRSTTGVSACPLPVHHLVMAPVCISSVVRICEWGGCWETGFVHTESQSSRHSHRLDLPSFRQQCEKKDDILFESIRSNRNHVLAGLLPPVKETGYDLRTRAHDFVLPCAKTNKLVDKNFLHRVLFKNMY